MSASRAAVRPSRKRRPVTAGKATADAQRPPTYQELADLVCELVETNIANVDSDGGRGRFVKCFTYSTGRAPDHWHRAIAAREALVESRLVPRQIREVDRTKIRSMRPPGARR